MEQEVRLRPAARQFLALPLFAAAVMAAAYALSRRPPVLLIVLTAVLMIPQVYGVKLTATHLVYLRLLGPQRLPWASISQIEERPTSISIAVFAHSPISRDRLAAPRQGWVLRDPEYDAKVETLRSWWVAHRGPKWRPPGG
ncbi:MAG: hypothetical protein WCB04_10725 [Mycobacteriales bacterium]